MSNAKRDGRNANAGIVVQVTEEDFPEEIRETAGSIRMMTGREPSRNALCAALIDELDRVYAGWKKDDPEILRLFREHCSTVGREIVIFAGAETKEAFARGIGEDFGLIAEYPDGRLETLRAGEVSVRGTFSKRSS